jgi:hypothetical protein
MLIITAAINKDTELGIAEFLGVAQTQTPNNSMTSPLPQYLKLRVATYSKGGRRVLKNYIKYNCIDEQF